MPDTELVVGKFEFPQQKCCGPQNFFMLENPRIYIFCGSIRILGHMCWEKRYSKLRMSILSCFPIPERAEAETRHNVPFRSCELPAKFGVVESLAVPAYPEINVIFYFDFQSGDFFLSCKSPSHSPPLWDDFVHFSLAKLTVSRKALFTKRASLEDKAPLYLIQRWCHLNKHMVQISTQVLNIKLKRNVLDGHVVHAARLAWEWCRAVVAAAATAMWPTREINSKNSGSSSASRRWNVKMIDVAKSVAFQQQRQRKPNRTNIDSKIAPPSEQHSVWRKERAMVFKARDKKLEEESFMWNKGKSESSARPKWPEQ